MSEERGGERSLSRRSLLSLMGSLPVAFSGCLSGFSSTGGYIPEVSWSYETGGEVIGRPTVCDDMLYIGGRDGYLRAFAESGKVSKSTAGCSAKLFKYDLAGTNAPDVDGPNQDIQEVWKFPTDGEIAAAPLVVEGNIYFGSVDQNFYSLDAETGNQNWSIEMDGIIAGSAVYHDETLYIPSGHSGTGGTGVLNLDENGSIHAVNPENGEEVWKIHREEGIQTSLVANNSVLYHGCQDDSFTALDTESGEEFWRYEADDNFCASRPALSGGVIYVGCEDNRLHALDADSGEPVWRFETGNSIVSSPVATEDGVYFGSLDNNLYAVDPDTGEELWRFKTNAGVYSSPAYRDGIIYVGSNDGNMYAVNGENGEVVWVETTEAPVMSSPVVTEDIVYFGSNDNRVYAVKNKSVDEETYERYRKKLRKEEYGGMNRTEMFQSSIAEELNEEEREAVGLEGDEDGGGQAEEG